MPTSGEVGIRCQVFAVRRRRPGVRRAGRPSQAVLPVTVIRR
ncbi:hypothetical protein ACFQ1I_09635 [Kitasatospora arboriphila]